MKLLSIGVLFGAVNLCAASHFVIPDNKTDWAEAGRSRFAECEFKDAARAFKKALQFRPEDASLYYWLGKSSARMAEVAGPLRAAHHARDAQRNLERAVELEPGNREYARELFDFYLDSPEWVGGGLRRAALLVDKIAPDDPGEHALLQWRLNEAREDYHGPDWHLSQANQLPATVLGRIVP
jgi:tetratricopeptide (TPR) repeat protein